MKKPALALLVTASAALSACVSLQPMALPEGAAGKKDITIASRAPSTSEMWTTYIIPDTNFGVTTNKSGSAAVGVMFGPLGVAANMAYLAQMAEEASKSFEGKLPKNVPAQLQGSLSAKYPELRFTTNANEPVNGMFMIPGVNLQVVDDKMVTPTCSIRISEMQEGRAVWTAYYRSVFTRTFGVDDKTYLANEFGSAVQTCLNTAFHAYRLHTANQFKPARIVYENGNELDTLYIADNEHSLYYVNDQIGVNVVKQSSLKIKPMPK